VKITVPHLGNVYIAVEALLNEMGHELVLPPQSSRRTLTLGTKYSPETVCLPLKLGVGNILEGIELGADTVLMVGGRGPCRLGYYAALEEEILFDLGKKVEFIVLDHPKEDFRRLRSQLLPLIRKKGWRALIRGLVLAWEKLMAVEKLERTSHYVRPRESEYRITSQLLAEALQRLRSAATVAEIRSVCRQGCEAMLAEAVRVDYQPLRIGIVGEIYTILDSFSNLDLEERLGHLGAEVYRTVSLVEWLKDHVIRSSLGLYSNKHLIDKAQGYLHASVGGHGLESVARTVILAEEQYDGIIHILPFTCMPEIVAQCILPNVSLDYQIPVLSLVVDEHTGEAGFQTRLEAFVDLLARRSEGEWAYGTPISLSRS
jgi:predicted nucleotide-binding protein (sugar kinase/HSP70/actin superfamily)